MFNDFLAYLIDRRRRRRRRRTAGSAGVLGFLAGAFLAGKAMIVLGLFRLGVTPNGVILNYWPGFVVGGLACGFLAAAATRVAMATLAMDED